MILIVDYKMPYFDGVETVKSIRNKMKISSEKTEVIMMHNLADDLTEIKEELSKNGVSVTISKPIKLKELIYSLNNIRNTHLLNKKIEIDREKDKIKVNKGNNKPVILVAEDVKMNLILVKAMLNQILTEVDIEEAENGKKCIEILNNKSVDLILMDIHMPEMDGIETTGYIRGIMGKNSRELPIIALTAGAIKEDMEKCIESGMNDFLTKPIEKEILKKSIEKYLIHKDIIIKEEVKAEEKLMKLSFDKERLMDKIENDKSTFKELIEVSIEKFPMYIYNIENGITEENETKIRINSHSLAGAAATMCFTIIAEKAKEIEENRGEDREKLKKYMEELKSEWKNMEKVLRKMIL